MSGEQQLSAGDLERAYALPLFALVDRRKLGDNREYPDALADHLQLWLENACGIRALSAQFVYVHDTPYLLLAGVDAASLPALCSLVDVQRTELYRYQRPDPDTVVLTPLRVKVDDAGPDC